MGALVTTAPSASGFCATCKQAWPCETAKRQEVALGRDSVETRAAPACAARRLNLGANDPQDCDWPFCGCDPRADRVLDAIEESGAQLVRSNAAFIVLAVNHHHKLVSALRQMYAAACSLMDEMDEKRAADWGVVNDAMVAASRVLAEVEGK